MNPPTRRPPTIVLGPAVLGVALVITPIVGLLQRAPWTNLLERLADDTVVEAIRVSMVVSLVAAVVSTVLGLPLAWLLARTEGRRLSKRRYYVADGDFRWEVDEFLDRELVLAEVELADPALTVTPPKWLASLLVREVTGEPEFLNVNLAR